MGSLPKRGKTSGGYNDDARRGSSGSRCGHTATKGLGRMMDTRKQIEKMWKEIYGIRQAKEGEHERKERSHARECYRAKNIRGVGIDTSGPGTG